MPSRPSLPSLLVVTDRTLAAAAGRLLSDAVEAALDGGAAAVLFREKDLDDVERLALGRTVAAVTRAADAPLLVAGDHLLAAQLGAVGVHLSSNQRIPDVPPGMLVGRSCHSASDVEACGGSVSYATLSPMYESISKPGHGADPTSVVGVAEVARVATATSPPIYALGGIAPGRARGWLEAGAAGVAVCGAVMGATEPWRVVADLVAELGDAPLVGEGS